MTPEPENPDTNTNDSANGKNKDGRTPLKQLPKRPANTPASSTPLRRRRKRIGGKRTVRSCTSCRAAHVRCVADRYGVPCERCAKKSWMDCTLMQIPEEKAPAKNKTESQPEVIEVGASDTDELQKIASDTLELMTETEKSQSL
ncbi:hypothetical protein F5Y08DRAFT_340773 [Xylaria arbuscula]|uniref:Zn(2)-C6 fungal-type domain-containing protein n=1 Tax=Xylaria arbuscula TaxID=114810 RepID=A0A9W8N7H6_9PEZI|nr:hypothetical protein F5Y08DRAFT_340773 [Xylaria arbuscula]KAJ3561321.1 hypothetical protein NPX13_g8991 [Xylaria arbuscula]